MASRWKASLIAFLLFLTRFGCSHESDQLDDLLLDCQSKHEVWNGIVDVKASIARGAELLQGRFTNSYEMCAQQCCEDGRCDLSLYRLEGVSDQGNNCYFIRCGKPAFCKIIEHDAFVYAFMSSGISDGEDGRENVIRIKPTEDAESTVPPTVDEGHASPSTDAPEAEKATNAPSTDEDEMDLPDSTDAPPAQLSDSSSPEYPPDQELVGTVSTEEVDECEQSGCNGTGAIIFAVLGGIAVLLLSLIVLALAKRVYDSYKRKQFGNVDYLINGMYA